MSTTIEVSIMGQSYMLACAEGEQEALRHAVAEVDREMCSIRDLGRIRARERIAVLAALNLAYQLAERGPVADAGGTADADIAALVQRIDAVLAGDDRLL